MLLKFITNYKYLWENTIITEGTFPRVSNFEDFTSAIQLGSTLPGYHSDDRRGIYVLGCQS